MTKRQLLIVSAPSGAGKSTFLERAVVDFPSQLVDSVSYTTRPMRPHESPGSPYIFVDREEFLEKKSQGFFVENAEVFGHLYGTPLHQLEDAWKAGKCLVMDIDIKGAAHFKSLYPDGTFVFILPPSMEELRRRLLKRDGGKTTNLAMRLQAAAEEMEEAKKFDYRIVNDDFEVAYAEFKKIVEDLLKYR